MFDWDSCSDPHFMVVAGDEYLERELTVFLSDKEMLGAILAADPTTEVSLRKCGCDRIGNCVWVV